MTLELQTIAQYSALRIVDSITEGTLVAAFAAIVYRLARRQSAGTRFAIWFSALIAIAGLPLLGGLSIQSRVPNAIHRAAITIPNTWALYVFSAWAVIAGYFLVGVARAVWHLHSLRKRCTPLAPSDLPAIMQETLRRSNLSRKVVICTSKQVRVPTALGLARPAIVIPDWAMRELSPADVNQILLHELAHLRRWDDWTNLAQQLVERSSSFIPPYGGSRTKPPSSARSLVTTPCSPKLPAQERTPSALRISPSAASSNAAWRWHRPLSDAFVRRRSV